LKLLGVENEPYQPSTPEYGEASPYEVPNTPSPPYEVPNTPSPPYHVETNNEIDVKVVKLDEKPANE
jgi:hypothetical protein